MSNLKNFQALLIENGYDAAIVSDQLNQHYLSGFEFHDGVVLVLQKDAYLLTDFRYVEAAKENACEGMQVLTPEKGATDAIRTLLGEHNCTRVAIEEDNLSYASYERYKSLFVGVTLVGGASALLVRQRLHKSDDEIEAIARAQRVTDAAFAHIIKVLIPEMTEIDVALELEMFMRRQGAQSLAFDTIAVSGSASSRPHGVPRPVKLERGFLTMDFGALYKGYCSDMTRMVGIGKPTEEMIDVYAAVQRAQSAALDAFAIGKTGEELDAVARNVIYHAGYEGCFGHGLGHGVGMDIHEAPRLKAGHTVPMDVGMVVTCEPGIYLEGKFGVRIEDMVVFTENGPLNITRSPKNLLVID